MIIGQPDVDRRKIDNPLVVPNDAQLSDLPPVGRAKCKGLNEFPQDQWPDNIPLLYYSYHIMVGLGTIFIAIMAVAAFLLWRGKLYRRALDALDPDAERCRSRTSPIRRAG